MGDQIGPEYAGQQLYHLARRLLQDAEALKAQFIAPSYRVPLSLGLMAALDVRRVMQLLAPVLSAEDGVALRLTRTDSPCDARILCETAKRPGEAFHSLWQERFIVAIPEGHPLGLKPEILVPDLATVPLVAREYCSNELFEGARRLGLKLEVAASALSEDWALALVEAGVGIAILLTRLSNISAKRHI